MVSWQMCQPSWSGNAVRSQAAIGVVKLSVVRHEALFVRVEVRVLHRLAVVAAG